MGDLEKQEKMVEEEGKDEGEKERLLEGMAVLDFDMLCSTVALQTHGKWSNLGTVGDGEEGEEFGGVFRMWEGELFDCFDDHRVALESTCCPCYRFGKNMRRAGFGSSYIQGTVYFILTIGVLLSFITFIITKRHCYLYMAVAFTITVGTYLGFFRTQIRKKFNIKESRTLEMNNVQDGTWHGRGDTICIGGFGEGSKAILDLHPPPHVSIKSIDHSGMQKSANASQP